MNKTIPLVLASLSLCLAGSAFSADKPLKSVGVSVGDLANPFFVAIGRGAEETAKKINPAARVTTVSSKYDLNTQVGQIENFIGNKHFSFIPLTVGFVF